VGKEVVEVQIVKASLNESDEDDESLQDLNPAPIVHL
jgi:hypothetical protein